MRNSFTDLFREQKTVYQLVIEFTNNIKNVKFSSVLMTRMKKAECKKTDKIRVRIRIS